MKLPFSQLGLSPELLKAVEKMGYEEASPIQSQAIPALLAGSDVVGQSQTGSGKTAAFAIPAIEKADPSIKQPQVLILCPTRELAVQVAEEVAKLSFFKRGLRELPIYGGQSYERQFKGLQQGAQIIIGTPGRVMDHLRRGTIQFSALKMVILDEADRMLDMGFFEDIRTILSQAPAERQTVFFSATMPKPIQELIKKFTHSPTHIAIKAESLTVPNIDQVYYEVDRRSKLDVLCRLIDLDDVKFGIIFCATKLMVDELTEHLAARGYAADKMHGDMTQAMRERVIAKFRRHQVEFLVATDVAARGLDVEDIEVVFNYDLPQDAEDYVHRIGRTGRAGRSGKAVTFVAGREIYKLQNILRFTKAKIRRERPPSEEEVEEKRANSFLESLENLLQKGDYKRQDELIGRLLDQGHSATDIASALIHQFQNTAQKPAAPAPVNLPSREDRDFKKEERFDRPPRREREIPRERPERKRPREEDKFAHPSNTSKPANRTPWDKMPARDKAPTPPPEVYKPQPGMERIILGAGSSHGVQVGDVVGLIAGLTKTPTEEIGVIRLKSKQAYVEVKKEKADQIVDKLNGIDFKDRKLWAKKGS